MSSRHCYRCSGTGRVPTGDYEQCSACGGQGFRLVKENTCGSCGGSGKSHHQITNACGSCGGFGQVPVDDVSEYNNSRNSPPSQKNTSSSTKQDTSTHDGAYSTSGGVGLIIGGIGGVISYFENNDLEQAITTGIIVWFVSSLALIVGYWLFIISFEVVKVTIRLLLVALVVTIIAYILGFEWAHNLLNF